MVISRIIPAVLTTNFIFDLLILLYPAYFTYFAKIIVALALAFSTVAVTVALPGTVPAVNVVTATPFTVVSEELAKVPKESVISLVGNVKVEKQAPKGIEIRVENYEVLSEADRDLPIQVIEKGAEETSLPVRLDYRWIDLRKPQNLLIFKIFISNVQCVQSHSPK